MALFLFTFSIFNLHFISSTNIFKARIFAKLYLKLIRKFGLAIKVMSRSKVRPVLSSKRNVISDNMSSSDVLDISTREGLSALLKNNPKKPVAATSSSSAGKRPLFSNSPNLIQKDQNDSCSSVDINIQKNVTNEGGSLLRSHEQKKSTSWNMSKIATTSTPSPRHRQHCYDVSLFSDDSFENERQNGSHINPSLLRLINNLEDKVDKQISENQETRQEYQEIVDSLSKRCNDLETELNGLKSKEKEKSKMKIPPEVSTFVHNIYKPYQIEGGWNFNKKYRDRENVPLSASLLQTMEDRFPNTSVPLLKKSLNRYFENLKREFVLAGKSEEEKTRKRKQRNLISRRHKLWHARENVDFEDQDDIATWKRVNAWAMSDQESDGENDYICRTLPWRSEDVTELLHRIDVTLGKKRRYGEPSERLPNEKCVEFSNVEC